MYYISSACGCSMGNVRSNNEDNFLFFGKYLEKENYGIKQPFGSGKTLDSPLCCCVFDGMGGEANGEEASYIAAVTMNELVMGADEDINSPKRFLTDACLEMNKKVCLRSAQLKSGRMGSTAAMLLFVPDKVYACNLGDSRVFRRRNGELCQLSLDHTDQKLMEAQGITGRKPRLTQHLGVFAEEMLIEPYIEKHELALGDEFLICSDGLTDMLSDEEISSFMGAFPDDPCECVSALIDAALEHGGRDNVTVIVLRVEQADSSGGFRGFLKRLGLVGE